jgi:glycine betaine/proline transport system ATP-binding protein
MKQAKLHVRNLTKVFGKNPKKALDLMEQGKERDEILDQTGQTIGVNQADFDVYTGETLVVMGLSGSGKSTLLRCINRLIEPTTGSVEIDGQNVLDLNSRELREVRRKKFGMVFQHFALFSHRTVISNVEYGLEVQGVPEKERRDKALQAIDQVGLSPWVDSYPNELSGGMKQRVGLARALANDPDVLLMDEAFSALDPLIRTEMQDELMKLEHAVHKTILFITHDLDEALKLGDRIVLMKDGGIIQIGTPEEILTKPANEYVQKFLENVDLTKVLLAEDIMVKPERVVFLKDGPRTALHSMREIGASGLFVVNQGHELQGYITVERAREESQKGVQTLDQGMELYKEYAVKPDVPVKDLFRILRDNRYPLAVIDEKKVLKGIIYEGTIIAALAERSEY